MWSGSAGREPFGGGLERDFGVLVLLVAVKGAISKVQAGRRAVAGSDAVVYR